MLPIRSALQHATSLEQILGKLASFVEHLHRYRLAEVLPKQLAHLSARNADDVRAWACSLRKGVHDRYCLTAAGELWFDEICETYFAAEKRLDELAGRQTSAAVPASAAVGTGTASPVRTG